MVRAKKYPVILTDEEVKLLKSVIRKKKTSKTIRCRCQILLDIDEAHGKPFTHEQSAKSNGVCMATVSNTIKNYIDHGVQSVVKLNRSVNSDNAKRKVDGRAEARLIEIAAARSQMVIQDGRSVCSKRGLKSNLMCLSVKILLAGF